MSYVYSYPRPAVTVDVVAIAPTGDSLYGVLLIRRKHAPFINCWALPGGFVDAGESLETAALRELHEETGVTTHQLQQIGAYGNPERDPRGWTISVAYLSSLPTVVSVLAMDDAADARWFPIHSLPPLAFDHNQIIADGLRLAGLHF